MSLRLLAAAAAIVAVSPAFAETRTVEVGAFTNIDIASGITAEVVVGPALPVTVEGPRGDILDRLRIVVEGDTLKAWIDWSIFDIFVPTERNILLRISVPEIASLESSSGAKVTATGVAGSSLSFEASSGASLIALGVIGDTYRLESSSGASLTVDGTCTTAHLDTSSGASIHAEKLICADVTADSSSGAYAAIGVSGKIKADASSGGSLVFEGRPTAIEQDSDSGGSIAIHP